MRAEEGKLSSDQKAWALLHSGSDAELAASLLP